MSVTRTEDEPDNGWHTPDSIYDAMAVDPEDCQPAAPTRTDAERVRVILDDRISWHTPERLDGILTIILHSPRPEGP